MPTEPEAFAIGVADGPAVHPVELLRCLQAEQAAWLTEGGVDGLEHALLDRSVGADDVAVPLEDRPPQAEQFVSSEHPFELDDLLP
jgi:hypothetical protein